ncbi:MAG: SPOR domain-containing protein, partial [Gammaproteobacteria bacterium]|nr:SPOR domain-containing protein [Gammaproteobacteria bacterium]
SRTDTRVVANESSQRRAAAQSETEKQEPRTVARAEASTRERRGFFNIRLRGRDSSPTTSRESEAPEMTPAQVVETSPTMESTRTTTNAQPQVSISTRPSERLSANPSDTPSRQSVSQRPGAVSAQPAASAPQPVAIVRVPLADSSSTATARRAVSPAMPDVPLDGLGGDYDYAVQLAAFTNYGLSSDFLSSYPSLDLMRVKTLSKGKTFYIVIAGTFENKNLASAQSQMLTSTYGIDEPYIRTVRSIRDVQIN